MGGDRGFLAVERLDGPTPGGGIPASEELELAVDGNVRTFRVSIVPLPDSDEEMLSASDVSEYLKAVSWGPFNQISRAYLLLSYDPHRQGYPYFQLYP